MPGHHTPAEKRQAAQVAQSERARGYSREEAESIGWATVNARRQGAKRVKRGRRHVRVIVAPDVERGRKHG